MENGLISVDRWTAGSQVYFLTHLHSDHTQGLTSGWARGPLFCSRLTAKLFPTRFPDFDLTLLRVVDIGVWNSVPLVSPSSGSRTVARVMAIDAHHCPGAVMFLFRGDFGCLLYTGDFRWETTGERAKMARAMLVNALNGRTVDNLHLDNTYCNPSYDFPPREVAAQEIVNLIASHPKHDVVIGIDSLGKEDLLLHIALSLGIKVSEIFHDCLFSSALKLDWVQPNSELLVFPCCCKIWVWPERLQTMHILGFHDTFTTKTSLTRVRAVPRYSFSIETLEALNATRPTIGIMPSGLPWVVRPVKGDANLSGSHLTARYKKRQPSGSSTGVEKLHQYMYSVLYSDHSCFSEIQEFMELVQPTIVKGIVCSSACYVEPLYFFGRLCGVFSVDSHVQTKRRSERAADVEINKSAAESGVEAVRKKMRSRAYYAAGGVKVSRTSVLRRVSRGAKIMDNDSAD
ncbi:unnamed protein product [Linum tenue]|uniref:Protein artemis n=1 Tax=Linum tenue TaxID=586396 RepID=A0AAV0QZB3_9ROSI|nr:unnamed protein product [Linum tenue]